MFHFTLRNLESRVEQLTEEVGQYERLVPSHVYFRSIRFLLSKRILFLRKRTITLRQVLEFTRGLDLLLRIRINNKKA